MLEKVFGKIIEKKISEWSLFKFYNLVLLLFLIIFVLECVIKISIFKECMVLLLFNKKVFLFFVLKVFISIFGVLKI